MNIEQKLKKIIDPLKQTHLTVDEKFSIRQKIYSAIEASGGIVSPYVHAKSSRHTFSNYIHFSKTFKFTTSLLVVLSLTGGTLTYAAQNSLPGDSLYPIKTDFSENILRVIHSTSPVARANFETTIMEKRLVEAEDLAKSQKLNSQNEASIQTAITVQENRVTNAVVALSSHDTDKGAPAASSTELFVEQQFTNNTQEGTSTQSVSRDAEATTIKKYRGQRSFSKKIIPNLIATTTITNSSSTNEVQKNQEGDKENQNVSNTQTLDTAEIVNRVTKVFDDHQGIINRITADERHHRGKEDQNTSEHDDR
jgi:hypothetical protein